MDYRTYLTDYLNVDHYIRPEGTVGLENSIKVHFFIIENDSRELASDEVALLERLTLALSLKPQERQWRVVSAANLEKCLSANVGVVIMSSNPETLKAHHQSNKSAIFTFDPRTLLNEPDKKKLVWQQLQALKQT